MPVILLLWKVSISAWSRQILGFILPMKTGKDKLVKLWDYNLEVFDHQVGRADTILTRPDCHTLKNNGGW